MGSVEDQRAHAQMLVQLGAEHLEPERPWCAAMATSHVDAPEGGRRRLVVDHAVLARTQGAVPRFDAWLDHGRGGDQHRALARPTGG